MSDTITITGNIAADPERRLTGSGIPVTTFRVASSQRRFDRGKGQWVETGTNWYQVAAFRALATHAFASLHRGERVIVTGRLRLRQWETATKKGLSVEIDADGIGHDLLWGTSQYSRAARDDDAWAVPQTAGQDTDAAGEPRGVDGADAVDAVDGADGVDGVAARGWPTAVPGSAGAAHVGGGVAVADATVDGGGERGGDWGAPAQPVEAVAPDRELQDAPF